MNNTKQKVIPDKFVSGDIFNKIVSKVGYSLLDKEYKQIDIINECNKYKLSRKTIARVINELIPTARATQGSVTSLIRSHSVPKDYYDKILNELLEGDNNE